MANTDIKEAVVYIHESIVNGHHVYKEVWTPSIWEVCSTLMLAMLMTGVLCPCLRQTGQLLDMYLESFLGVINWWQPLARVPVAPHFPVPPT